jgi:actin-related protein
VGKDCKSLMGVLKLRYPMKNGVFQNDQDILNLFGHIYNKLGIKSEEIKEYPIFITEPILNPYSHRKQVASALFDNMGVPALSFGSQPILSLYASGQKSGVVLESGDAITQCCVVFEGYSIPHSYLRFDYGGRNVTEYLQTLLKRQGYSFTTTAEFEIVKQIKEKFCSTLLSSSSSEETKKIGETSAQQYFLPDGNFVMVKEEKVLAPEIMFNPSMIGLEHMCKIYII